MQLASQRQAVSGLWERNKQRSSLGVRSPTDQSQMSSIAADTWKAVRSAELAKRMTS